MTHRGGLRRVCCSAAACCFMHQQDCRAVVCSLSPRTPRCTPWLLQRRHGTTWSHNPAPHLTCPSQVALWTGRLHGEDPRQDPQCRPRPAGCHPHADSRRPERPARPRRCKCRINSSSLLLAPRGLCAHNPIPILLLSQRPRQACRSCFRASATSAPRPSSPRRLYRRSPGACRLPCHPPPSHPQQTSHPPSPPIDDKNPQRYQVAGLCEEASNQQHHHAQSPAHAGGGHRLAAHHGTEAPVPRRQPPPRRGLSRCPRPPVSLLLSPLPLLSRSNPLSSSMSWSTLSATWRYRASRTSPKSPSLPCPLSLVPFPS